MAYRDSTVGTPTDGILVIDAPAGVAENDIVLLAVEVDDNTPGTVTWPADFTQLDLNSPSAPDGHSMGLAWKRATASEPATYTITMSGVGSGGAVILCGAWSGRHVTDPPTHTANASTASNTSPVSVTATGVTALTGDDLAWISLPDVTAGGIGNGHTPPTDYTEAEDAEADWTNGSLAYRNNVSAGATGDITGTFALTSGAAGWRAYLVRMPAAAGGNVTISPGCGTLAAAGLAAALAITQALTVAPGAGTATITGHAPTAAISSAVTLAPGAGSAAVTGYAPTVVNSGAAVTVAPGAGSVAITGLAPTGLVSTHATVTPGTGSLAISGQYVSTVFGGPGTGSVAITGYTPTVLQSPAMLIPAGSVALTGHAPTATTTLPGTVSPGVGSAALTGLAPTLQMAWVISPPAGALAFTGHAATLVDSGLATASRSPQARGRGRGR